MGDSTWTPAKAVRRPLRADGTGEWVELSINNAQIKGYAGYAFADQADVCVNAAIAADAVGATKMDRPSGARSTPPMARSTTLTNNSNRSVNPSGSSQLAPTPPTPRLHRHEGHQRAKGNPNGHIVRMKERRRRFPPPPASPGTCTPSAPRPMPTAPRSTFQPDGRPGLLQPRRPGLQPPPASLWIQTDDGAYTDVTNCMMLAASARQVGDGAKKTLSYTKADGSTPGGGHPWAKAPVPKAQALPGRPQGLRDHRHS